MVSGTSNTNEVGKAPETILSSSLVDKVGFVLVECESDEQLTAAVKKYLMPLLKNVSTNDEDTRTKVTRIAFSVYSDYLHFVRGVQVMEILTHLNKRIKSRPNVSIPVKSLLEQVQIPSEPVFFKVSQYFKFMLHLVYNIVAFSVEFCNGLHQNGFYQTALLGKGDSTSYNFEVYRKSTETTSVNPFDTVSVRVHGRKVYSRSQNCRKKRQKQP